MKIIKFKTGVAVVTISLLALGLSGCGTKKTVSELPPPAVKVQKVQLSNMPSSEAYLGTVTPYVQTLISPSIAGILSSVDVRVGDKVKLGQLLATLDTDLLKTQQNQAQANQAIARAQKEAAAQKTDSAQSQAAVAVNTAQTNLGNTQTAAEANLKTNQKTVEALKIQLDNQVAAAEKSLAVAQVQLMNASKMKENALDQAARAVASAEANLNAIEKQNDAVIAADQTNIDQLKASLATALSRLNQAQSAQPPDPAAVAAAQAAYNQLELSLESAKGKLEIDKANSGITAAKSLLNNARTAHDAAGNSAAAEAAAAQVAQTEQAVANAKATKTVELAKALSNLETAEIAASNSVKGATAQLAQPQAAYEGLLNDKQLVVNEAQVAAAQAGVSTIQAQIDKGRLSSPLEGYVVAVNAQVGQAVGPQGGFILISSMDPLIATVEVPEAGIAKFQQDLEMSVVIPATSERLKGKVSAIHPSPDPLNKKYLVDVEMKDNKQSLLSGMRVEAYTVDEGVKGILIPADSVVIQKSGAYSVFVVQDGVVASHTVKLGAMTGSTYEIISGLSEGQDLVIQGQNLLSEGDKVQIAQGNTSGS